MINNLEALGKHINEVVVIPHGYDDDFEPDFFFAENAMMTVWALIGVVPLVLFPLIFIVGNVPHLIDFLFDPAFTYPSSAVEGNKMVGGFLLYVVLPANIFCYGMFKRLGNSTVKQEPFEWMSRNHQELGLEAPRQDMTKRDLCRYVEKAMTLRNERLDHAKNYLS